MAGRASAWLLTKYIIHHMLYWRVVFPLSALCYRRRFALLILARTASRLLGEGPAGLSSNIIVRLLCKSNLTDHTPFGGGGVDEAANLQEHSQAWWGGPVRPARSPPADESRPASGGR